MVFGIPFLTLSTAHLHIAGSVHKSPACAETQLWHSALWEKQHKGSCFLYLAWTPLCTVRAALYKNSVSQELLPPCRR